ncbi:MAG: hypothetical protein LCH93_11860 [Proteobacteria bacterium]|nr:hypothetical protein [Pseudomonadota bacterium]
MKFLPSLALAFGVAACNSPPLEELSPTGPTSPEAPIVAMPDKPVMAGTAPHAPVGLKPWRELNDGVAPGAGRTP